MAGNAAAVGGTSVSGDGPAVSGAPEDLTFSRVERFASVASTNDVVRSWLAAGEAEICLATADVQTAGRGRHGRVWKAPPGAALLASLGFRPTWLPADRVWRLPATVALAMCDAAEEMAGLRDGAIRLKWPNDLVIELSGPHASVGPVTIGEPDAAVALERLRAPIELRKLAGVLGETDGLGTDDPRAVVGIGINVDWAAADFPADLAGAMTSLREASGGRPVSTRDLLDSFEDHVTARMTALRAGFFDVAAWAERQVTTGHFVELLPTGDGDDLVPPVRAIAVDSASGGLVVEDPSRVDGERLIHAGEVRHVRLAREQV
jgi:BirA family transcriptional regulator, biotin operon repressor / biotin---[acetyl-CoA-carboxylase] ligase